MKNTRHKEQPNNDVLVSIILTESTTSLLNLRIPNIEELCEMSGSRCIIKAINREEIEENKSILSYFFGSSTTNVGMDSPEIISELAYFSDNYKSDSEISVSDQEDCDDGVMLSKLEAFDVFTRPLIAVKSVEHNKKISIEDNDIYVSVRCEDEEDLICRICHGGSSLGDLLSPCRCKGSIALAHVECLEHWLRESAKSTCELCNHHFHIIRQPKYNIPWSILVYLANPGENLKDLLMDAIAFLVYTPSALVSTYMLMHICENIAKYHLNRTRNVSAHVVAFCAVFGMAAIDFTYSSWLIVACQRQATAWRSWYRNNCFLKLMLPEWKRKPYNHIRRKSIRIEDIDD